MGTFLVCDTTLPSAELILKWNQPVILPPSPRRHMFTSLVSCTDDESPGLYGFLNVIVHSATGFKQSSSK